MECDTIKKRKEPGIGMQAKKALISMHNCNKW